MRYPAMDVQKYANKLQYFNIAMQKCLILITCFFKSE